MTACVNNEGLSGKKVVSATLAGVLAAGMVPAIAFADEAAEASTDEGIDLLLIDNAADFLDGKIGAVVDQNNKAVTIPAKGNSLKVTQDGKNPVKVKVIQVVTKTGVVIDLNEDNAEWGFWKEDAHTNKADDAYLTGVNNPVHAQVKVTDDKSPYYEAVFKYDYTIGASALDGATIVDAKTKKSDFTYEAVEATDFISAVEVKLNGETVPADIVIYDKKTSAKVTGVMAAGDYVAEITANDGKYKGSKTQYAFTVNPLNLSKAEVLMQDLKDGEGIDKIKILKINGKKAEDALLDQLDVTYKSGPEGTMIVDRNGKYTVTLTPKEEAGKSITGQTDASFLKVTAVEEIKYKTEVFADKSVKTTDKSTYIEASGFTSEHVTSSDDILLKIVNEDGKEFTLDEMNTTPGVYTLTATIDSANLDPAYGYGGSNSMKVTVTKANVGEADVAISYKGRMLDDTDTADFTGQNIMDDIKVVVLDAKGKALTEGTDYAVEVTKDGKEVDKIVNRGSYKIEVTSDAYSFNDGGNVVSLTVNPMTISDVRVANTLTSRNTKDPNGKYVEFLPFTDAAITPAIEYKTDDGDWVSVPSDIFKLEYAYNADPSEELANASTPVNKMLKKGLYKVTVKDARADQDITFSSAAAGVCVLDEKVFADANPNDWYYNVIYKANQNQYMFGYLGSNLFGANDSITRADVVCVLYNMASENMITDDDGNKPGETFDSFADVDASKYYAKAIAWAKKAGIVNGFGDGTFNPEGNVTRQDFACMLANFAKVVGNFKTPADIDAVLAKFSDGNAVSDYAKESVAWACDQKIMGNNGMIMPQNTITRAEVAAMVVNYQPERI